MLKYILKELHSCRAAMVALVLIIAGSVFALPTEGVATVNNRDYAPAVQKLFQGAKKSIHIMLYQARNYDEYPDTLTNKYIFDLIAAKKRGVDVKIVIDTGDWNPSQKNEYNTDYIDHLTTSGIQIWEDSPSEVSHEKVICVDNDLTVVSSNNWIFYSLAKNNEVAVIVESPQLNAYFKRYFYDRVSNGKPHANCQPVAAADVPKLAEAASPAGAPSLKMADVPGLTKLPASDVTPIPNRLFYPAVHEVFLNATKSIDVIQQSIITYTASPHSTEHHLPGEPASETNVLVDDLANAAHRGLKVRVILDLSDRIDLPENVVTARYLRARGVEVLADDPTVETHAKMVVIDDDKSVVGSTNWTFPAIEEGNEASVMITSPQVNKVYKDYVNAFLQTAAPYPTVSKSIWDAPAAASKAK